jgi:hypothetical protein
VRALVRRYGCGNHVVKRRGAPDFFAGRWWRKGYVVDVVEWIGRGWQQILPVNVVGEMKGIVLVEFADVVLLFIVVPVLCSYGGCEQRSKVEVIGL